MAPTNASAPFRLLYPLIELAIAFRKTKAANVNVDDARRDSSARDLDRRVLAGSGVWGKQGSSSQLSLGKSGHQP